MCRISRSHPDPLLECFLAHHGLHLLERPRERMDVGALVIARGKATATTTSLSGLVSPDMPELTVDRGEIMADAQSVYSSGYEHEAGVSIADGFARALGVLGIAASLGAAGRHHKDLVFRFRFDAPTRDSVDPAYLAGLLVQRHVDPHSGLWDKKSAYYVVTAVARSASFDVGIERAGGASLEGEAELAELVGLHGKAAVERADESTLRFRGPVPIAFGVELFRLDVNPSSHRARLVLPESTVKVRSGDRELVRPTPAVIGGLDSSPFLTLTDQSENARIG